MPSLHALYDALVKALAVVESMERDMLSQLATKSDVEHAQLLMRADLKGLRKEFEADMALLQSTMTVRLGSMLIVGLSLLFAALKLT